MQQSLLFYLFLIVIISSCTFQNKKTSTVNSKHLVAFYNLENLFDTINTPNVNDGEFTPAGSRKWDSQKYLSKQANMSKVIADLGKDLNLNGPSIIGLCEVENKQVIVDLINQAPLKAMGYQILHYDSPDKRGIDVALLYKKDIFNIINSKTFPLYIYDKEDNERIYTRDQLLVTGTLNNETVHIIVNHWPSRYGGKKRSIPNRKAAALLNRQIIDSLIQENADAKIITMGDLNDDPIDESVRVHLNATAYKDSLTENSLFNPLAKDFDYSKGSLYYRGKWNLFDQIILSQGLLKNKGLHYDTAFIYKKPYLIQQDGKYKGYLLRTYGGKTYLNGYSDHLPVCLVLSE